MVTHSISNWEQISNYYTISHSPLFSLQVLNVRIVVDILSISITHVSTSVLLEQPEQTRTLASTVELEENGMELLVLLPVLKDSS